MTEAEFRVEVTAETARSFAELSGDWNPLHTDPAHAATTAFRKQVLHGAFSAGLLSRMAGMYLPGTDCLLHSLNLRFVAPILPPAVLSVRGVVESDNGQAGRVTVTVTDASTGVQYVEGNYGFGRHSHGIHFPETAPVASVDLGQAAVSEAQEVVLVTGASGAVGSAVLSLCGGDGIALPRSLFAPGYNDQVQESLVDRVAALLGGRKVKAIVHCGWPSPDNTALLSVSDLQSSVDHHVAAPLRQAIALAQLIEKFGNERAMLLLLGSTAADPGRHNYRMPLYSTAKSMVPTLTRALAVELGPRRRRVAAVVLDVVDGGMNERMSRSARVAHSARSPIGSIPSASDVADQLLWLINNSSMLASGAVLSLTGGAIP